MRQRCFEVSRGDVRTVALKQATAACTVKDGREEHLPQIGTGGKTMIFNMTGGDGSPITAPVIDVDFTWTGDSGTCQVLDDGNGDWRIKLLGSGTITFARNTVIDVFLVGGGGGRDNRSGGGGGGYTTTASSVVAAGGVGYAITVGAAGLNYVTGGDVEPTNGGASSAFGASAQGGFCSTGKPGANGGSGGAGASSSTSNQLMGVGGEDGGDGQPYSSSTREGGSGQGTTTREFGEADGDLYATGGGNQLLYTVANSGNGGGYSDGWVDPADGIVIIRKHK